MNRIAMILIACVLLSGCTQEQLVGNDKDENGCIASAGYTWCEAKQKCIRLWEELCIGLGEEITQDQERAIATAKQHLKQTEEYKKDEGGSIEVVDAIMANCDGCWIIKLDYWIENSKKPVQIILNDWSVVETIFGEETASVVERRVCEIEGGRVASKEEGCLSFEKDIGEITDSASEICCIEI